MNKSVFDIRAVLCSMGLRTLRAESTSRVGSTGSRLHLPFKEFAIFLSFFIDKSVLPLQCVKPREKA